jgi:hypothetical protein
MDSAYLWYAFTNQKVASIADVDGGGDLDIFVRLDGGKRVDEYDGQMGESITGFDAP